MEPKFQTSFIPKRQVSVGPEKTFRSSEGTNIFSLAATIFIIATALMYGGLFFYKKSLIDGIAQVNQEIADARAAIDPDTITKLLDANARMKATLGLLERHVVTSNFLVFLGDSTIRSLKFNDFTYQNKEGTPTISVAGQVKSYNGLAYQQKVLEDNELVKGTNFSDIVLGDNGDIKFKLESKFDSTLVSYKTAIESLTNEQ